MKTLFLNLFFIGAIALAFSSCKKEDNTPEEPQDNIVGTWDMLGADATAYIDGYAFDGIEVETDGTMEFDGNGTGTADFTMTFMGDTDELKGPFSWQRDGFEIVVSTNSEEQLRYAIITDEKDYQELQVTYEDESSNDEVEFLFKMQRIK